MSSPSGSRTSPGSLQASSAFTLSRATSFTDLSSSNEDIQLRGDLIQHDGKFIERKVKTLNGFCEHEDCVCTTHRQSTPQLVLPGSPGFGTFFYYDPRNELFYGTTAGELVPAGMMYADKNVHVLGTRRQLRGAGLQPSYAAQASALGCAGHGAVVIGSFVKGRGYRFDERLRVRVWREKWATSLMVTIDLDEGTRTMGEVTEKIEEMRV